MLRWWRRCWAWTRRFSLSPDQECDLTIPRRLRGTLVLSAAIVMGILATPGLDYMPIHTLRSTADQARLEEQVGPVGMRVAWGIAWFNRRVRVPVVKVLEPIQKPFRVAQSWNLYRDGPKRIRRLEVHVDGEPVFRVGDPDLDWLAGPLSNRKLRPVVESTARSVESRNWRGLARFVVNEARKDFPEAQSVALVVEVGDFPGRMLKESHRIIAESPGWEARLR